MSISLEQFFATRHLGVTPVANFVPSALLFFRDVVTMFQFSDDTLEISLADEIEQGNSSLINVIEVSHPGMLGHARENPSQFCLSLYQGH